MTTLGGCGVPSQAPAVGRLAETLRERVEETVRSVCSGFEQELGHAAQQQLCAAADVGVADEEVYYACCRRMVTYVAAHMATSPDFVEQMDRIILASHCNTPQRLLNLVVTEDLWLRRRGSESDRTTSTSTSTSTSTNTNTGSTRESHQGPQTDSVGLPGVATRARETKPSEAVASIAGAAPITSPHVDVIDVDDSDDSGVPMTSPHASFESRRNSPAAQTPSAKSSGDKKRLSVTWSSQKTTLGSSKRARRAVARVLLGGGASAEDASETKAETGSSVASSESEEVVEVQRTAGGGDSETPDSMEDATFVREKEEGDGRVSTDDAFGKLVHAAHRTPQQSKLYKSRLRKCIRIVDARACKPPPGKVCTQNCAELRTQLCYGSTFCSNKLCRLWHHAESHMGWCQASKCEFKNRLYLRDVLHKIEHKQASYEKVSADLDMEKKELLVVQEMGMVEREEAVWSKILKLERELDNEFKELRFLRGLKDTFWADLRSIGIEPWNDAMDDLPDFASHYAPQP